MLLRKKTIDATEGPIFSKMLAFVIPLMMANLMNHLYNMADNIVVGQFSGDPHALAAVGSTVSLNSAFVNLATGISIGAGVIVARAFGARNKEDLHRGVHTAMTLSILIGVVLGVIRFFISEPILVLMGTNAEILPKAVLYTRILSAGMPGTVVYTIGAAVLRSVGDSKTPLHAVTVAGLLNIVLNLFFVIACGMDVDGVAWATFISKYVSAAMVVFFLIKRKGEDYAFDPGKMRLDGKLIGEILYIGIPSAIQSMLYSLTNIFLTAALNTFPIDVMSARTIATNIDVLLSTAINTYLHASMTFTSQNYGARKPDRMKKSIFTALLQAAVIGFTVGQLMIIFREPLVNMYLAHDDPNRVAVMAYCKEIMVVMLSSYFIGAMVDSMSGFLRGLGASISSMIISMVGICGIRCFWIFVAFPKIGTLTGLYLGYPISWTLTFIGLSVGSIFMYKRVKRKMMMEAKEIEQSETANEEQEPHVI